jgi:signal transduction histidine kinase
MMIGFLAFFIGGLVIVFAPSMYRLAMGSSLTELEPAAREFLVLHLRVWPAALFIFGGMFVYTLFLSRRIAGPIYRVNSVLRQMIEGEYPEKVSLRYGDYFSETAGLLERLSRKAAGEQGKKEHRENESRGPAAK